MKTLVKSLALVVMFVALFSASSMAAPTKGKKQKAKKAVVLSAEEVALSIALDSFYEDLISDADLRLSQDTPLFDRVEVYDMKGKLLQRIDLNGKAFSELMVPPKAERLMIDNRTAFYIIAE